MLISQDYSNKADWEEHINYLLPFFLDDRYIKENGEPLFIIYSPEEIPNLDELTSYIRKRVKEAGFPGIKLMYQYYVSENKDSEVRKCFDYRIEFQPVHALHDLEANSKKGILIKAMHFADNAIQALTGVNASDHLLKVRKTSYDDVWKTILSRKPKDSKEVACAFVNWDNTPRRGQSGRVTVGATPEKFKEYMQKLIKKVKEEYSSEYIFVTAWNEWSEGSYLEPDQENGYAYLNSVKAALEDN